MKTFVIPKGEAMALHLTPEYQEGLTSISNVNPYDYWNEYTKNYAWCIGHQQGQKIGKRL